jgi:hypothetical protein
LCPARCWRCGGAAVTRARAMTCPCPNSTTAAQRSSWSRCCCGGSLPWCQVAVPGLEQAVKAIAEQAGGVCRARTRAEHLTWASILSTRALPPRLSAHDPVVRLAGAARTQQYLQRHHVQAGRPRVDQRVSESGLTSTENTSSEPLCEFWHGTGGERAEGRAGGVLSRRGPRARFYSNAVLTISNQLAGAPGEHPLTVDKRKLRKVSLHHLSWSQIRIEAAREGEVVHREAGGRVDIRAVELPRVTGDGHHVRPLSGGQAPVIRNRDSTRRGRGPPTA